MKFYDKDKVENWDHAIEEAAQVIREGGLVAFPTETVYGLGADAQNAQAVQKIYAAKGRPADNPLIVHIADKEDLTHIAKDIADWVFFLTEKYWPGPLSVVLNRQDNFGSAVSAGLSTVAVRMPDNQTALALIKKSGKYIAAPSANLSGRPSPTKAKHVVADMGQRIDVILAQDNVRVGIESTVIDARGSYPIILRTGGITQEMLINDVGKATLAAQTVEVPLAPGMKYGHYQPRAKVMIVAGAFDKKIEKIKRFLKKEPMTGQPTMATGQIPSFRKPMSCEKGCKVILCEEVEKKEIGTALANRMEKAAVKCYL